MRPALGPEDESDLERVPELVPAWVPLQVPIQSPIPIPIQVPTQVPAEAPSKVATPASIRELAAQGWSRNWMVAHFGGKRSRRLQEICSALTGTSWE